MKLPQLMACGRTPSLQLACALLAATLLGCAGPRCAAPQVKRAEISSDLPAIVIRQYPDYPAAGRGSQFPGGLVAALWRDGRMIRPASPDAVGKSYVEGAVRSDQREEFFTFLSGSQAVRAPEGGSAPIDAAS